MEEVLNLLVLLAILSVGFSVMLSPLTGKKVDPFLLIRPIARPIAKIPGALCRRASNALGRWSNASWQRMTRPRTSFAARCGFLLLWAILGILSLPFELLAEILGLAAKSATK